MDTQRDCLNCRNNNPEAKSLDDVPAQCWDCAAVGNKGTLPLFIAKETMHPYDAAFRPEEEKPKSALDVQVAGDHYKEFKIQPIEFAMVNNLDACQTIALRYLVRKKGGKEKVLEDIDKAIHTMQIRKQLIMEGRINV